MSFVAMNTNNPLGQRPFQQMGGVSGDFDFPGAPVPWRMPPEMLGGNAIRELANPPYVPVMVQPSPWDSPESVMMLADYESTATQTVVQTTDTTPTTSGAVPSGQPVAQSWFSDSSMIPGISNWEILIGAIAIFALMKGGK